MYLLPLFLVFTLASAAPYFCTDLSVRIDDEYIVIYNNDISNDLINAHQASLSLNLIHTYNISSMFRGFAAHLTTEELNKVLETPFIKEVHCNGVESLFCDMTQDPVKTWGLARVSYPGNIKEPVLRELFHYNSEFQGQNVYVYILDTGIFREHNEFATGRVRDGVSYVSDTAPAYVDENGHGTHCAGTAAGNTFGFAREAQLIPVKVLGAAGSGATSGVIKGIEYVAINHQASGGPSVGSMSLGSTADGGKNAAISAAVSVGAVFSVAAGNSNGNACLYYPASCPDAITAGATTLGPNNRDDRSSFSNYGSCVHIFAPGSNIPSAGISSRTAVAVLSGTSMACPHVTGYVANMLSENPNLTPREVRDKVQASANRDLISNPGLNSPNLLLYNGC
jgi:subtilisin family serine protease